MVRCADDKRLFWVFPDSHIYNKNINVSMNAVPLRGCKIAEKKITNDEIINAWHKMK